MDGNLMLSLSVYRNREGVKVKKEEKMSRIYLNHLARPNAQRHFRDGIKISVQSVIGNMEHDSLKSAPEWQRIERDLCIQFLA
jgi:hypothetical protein